MTSIYIVEARALLPCSRACLSKLTFRPAYDPIQCDMYSSISLSFVLTLANCCDYAFMLESA
jgi:hypothetical protein